MNRMILAGRRKGGLIDAVKGADLSGDRQGRLNAAMVRYESACRDGREIEAEIADAEIDEILTEARSARSVEMSNVGHDVQQALPASGFDGGFRGARKFRPAWMDAHRDPSPTSLMKAALDESARRRETDVRVPPAA